MTMTTKGIAAVLLCSTVLMIGCGTTRTVYAQKDAPQPSIFKPGTSLEKITVFGKEFTIKPYQVSDSSTTWATVKGDLPQNIFSAPVRPMSDADILNALENLRRTKAKVYERDLATLAGQQSGKDIETAELDIAGELAEQMGKQKYPQLQKTYNEHQALDYLIEMLRQAMGMGAPRY